MYGWNRKEYKTRVPSRVSVRMVFSEGIQTEAIQESKMRIINAGNCMIESQVSRGYEKEIVLKIVVVAVVARK